jgi:hypothetical protein
VPEEDGDHGRRLVVGHGAAREGIYGGNDSALGKSWHASDCRAIRDEGR